MGYGLEVMAAYYLLCLCKLTCSDNITSQSILFWFTVEEDGDNQVPVGDDSDSDEDGK